MQKKKKWVCILNEVNPRWTLLCIGISINVCVFTIFIFIVTHAEQLLTHW